MNFERLNAMLFKQGDEREQESVAFFMRIIKKLDSFAS